MFKIFEKGTRGGVSYISNGYKTNNNYLKSYYDPKQTVVYLGPNNLLNGIKVQVLFRKNIGKKHFCRHDKNYYYFWKSNIPAGSLIVDSRNMIKVSKICDCKKLDK